MGDISKMVTWFKDRERKVIYSNIRPWGLGNPAGYDCSAAVIEGLRAGNFITNGSNTGWTGSLHDSILPSISRKISRAECKRGDIFISKWFAFEGHTGIFLDSNTIIHCNASDMTIATTIADGRMGEGPYEFYRLNNANDSNTDTVYSDSVITNSFGGIFYPNISLPVSGDTNPSSPALAYYNAGDAISYDSYMFINGYAWISYIASSGLRRYVAVGPDDGRVDTVWGKGFFN